MTREVRGSSRRRFLWDRPPRILFATADDRDFPANTVEAHLLALRRALEPWATWDQQAMRATSYPIDIIEQASVERIRLSCLEQDYTHVHILAHGAPIDARSDVRFGLRLHEADNPGKRVTATGDQLAHALLPSRSRRGVSDPVLVSLATCDSGNQSAVITPGGSIAHQLHHMGVPWVVASQFPLTVVGSVVLAEDLYNELLQGTIPGSPCIASDSISPPDLAIGMTGQRSWPMRRSRAISTQTSRTSGDAPSTHGANAPSTSWTAR